MLKLPGVQTMTLRDLKNAPEKMMPAAMAFIAGGLSILSIGIVWPGFSPPVPHQGTDWTDFCRGILYGLAIAMEVAGIVIAAAAANKRKAL